MKLLICTQAMDKNHPILGFFHRWVEEFAKHCEVVHVICLIEGEHKLPANVHVHSLGKEHGKNRLRELWRFYTIFGKLFFTGKIDHVFYHMGAIYNIVGAPFYILRKFKGVKFYWWKANGQISRQAHLAGYFTDTIVTSTASGYSHHLRRRKIVGQAIDTDLFQFSNSGRDEKKVLYVGRIMPIKQLEVFVAVAKKLIPQGYSFVVAGPVVSNAYTDALLKTFTEVGIVYIGPKSYTDLVSLYQNAGYFLNTSLTHSMDKTVLEAMLCGCIPLTANKAFADLLAPEGLYFEKQEAEAYKDLIVSLEQKNNDLLRVRLRSVVVGPHSLTSFFDRIFKS